MKVKLQHGQREQIVTAAAAGIDGLVTQFAKGDRHARRDLIALAEKLGVDLTTGQSGAIENALTTALATEDEALITDFLKRHRVEREPGGPAIESDRNHKDPKSPSKSREN